MDNLQVKKYFKMIGWVIAFLWLISFFVKLFFCKEYMRVINDNVAKTMLVLYGLYLFVIVGYQLKYNKENFVLALKVRFKEMWPQLFFLISILLLWFLNKNSFL